LRLRLSRIPLRKFVNRKWLFVLLPLLVQPLQVGIAEIKTMFLFYSLD
jgi:hypothetical protein